MFFVHKTGLHQDIFDRNSLFFSSAELPLFHPWFLCEVPEYEGEEILTYSTHLFADLDSLSKFTSLQIPTRAYVVSPGYLNKTERWMLQVLRSVSKAKFTHDLGNSDIYRFEIENGDVIFHNASGISKSADELSFETILQFN
ncbi:hypothetical protein [Methylophilus sp. 3sh_L]|uniref:hypothetical protein n=1 Tax=Methylophilus sp. 3sh_L TaxID=3377114 RepID=UPI00398E6480